MNAPNFAWTMPYHPYPGRSPLKVDSGGASLRIDLQGYLDIINMHQHIFFSRIHQPYFIIPGWFK